jgi:nucleotide-binding universal stress UspA family protein
MAGRCLIVANQTLGGDALDGAVKDCMSRDVRLFYIVVPLTQVEHETTGWGGGFVLGDDMPAEVARAAMEENARRHEAELDEAQRRAQHRLDLMIDKIQSMGGDAEGEIGVDDPLEATEAVLEQQSSFDEIIVSTLPGGLSRWLKMDLPNRIARLSDVPVTTIEAEADDPA